jgi:DNA-binding SARP family transcriptional activator/tetratricopeptide (TPR) repeat protein
VPLLPAVADRHLQLPIVEFRLLGPVEVVAAGRKVTIGRRHERSMLAILLLEAGRPVPVDRLVELTWETDQPRAPHEVIQTYASRLRRVLTDAGGPADGVALSRRGRGYAIDVDPMSVDAHRFESLLARARAIDIPEQRSEVLREALDLWRGPVLADVGTEIVRQRLGARLEEHRRDAEELWITSELENGRHGELIGELTELTARSPLDERLVYSQMLALYRAGRRSDALAAYGLVRDRLREELGLDPGVPLQGLHSAILREDPALDLAARPSGSDAGTADAPAGGSPASPVPAQLPAAVADFTGREEQVAWLDARLPASVAEVPTTLAISAVAGTAGVGKTALAVWWAHRAAPRFPDGQLFVDLHGFGPGKRVEPIDVLAGFLRALGIPGEQVPVDSDEATALYRSVVAGRRLLVVLDNAENADHARPLLPGSPTCLVVVTSRNQMTGLVADGAQPLTVDLLPRAEAYELLERRLGRDRVAAEPDAADEIVGYCAGLPLALAIVGARAAAHPAFPLAVIAGQLRDARDRLDMFDGGDQTTDLRAVFASSYDALSAEAARLFRLLGLHQAPDIGTAAAASLAGVPVRSVRPSLAELARAHLVMEHTPGRYLFHDLLRAYAAELAAADAEDENRAAVRRVLDYYLRSAYAADRMFNPSRDPITLPPPASGVAPEAPADDGSAADWVGAERPVLLAMVELAAANGFDAHAWQLAWSLSTYFSRRGYWPDEAAAQGTALTAAQRLGDRRGQALAHKSLGTAIALLGRRVDAAEHFRQGAELCAALGDHVGEAHNRFGLSWVSGLEKQYETALEQAQYAFDGFLAGGHLPGQARTLNAVGWTYALLGEYRHALRHCERALEVNRELGDRYIEAETHDSLGYAYHHLGDHARAVAHYRRSLELHGELGDRYRTAETLIHLGDAHAAAADSPAAREAWAEALRILEDLGHSDAEEARGRLAGPSGGGTARADIAAA